MRQGGYFENIGVINGADSEQAFRFEPGGEIGPWLTIDGNGLYQGMVTVTTLRVGTVQVGAEIGVNVDVTGGPLNQDRMEIRQPAL